jgi:hypothetical protein
MSKVYVASSWRNPYYDDLVETLRRHGHSVHDWRRSGADGNGFKWEQLDQEWPSWTPQLFVEALTDPIAEAAFYSDRDGIDLADTVIMLAPAGVSAALELGYAAGKGKRTFVLLSPLPADLRADLMLSLADRICVSKGELLAVLSGRTLSGACW